MNKRERNLEIVRAHPDLVAICLRERGTPASISAREELKRLVHEGMIEHGGNGGVEGDRVSVVRALSTIRREG